MISNVKDDIKNNVGAGLLTVLFLVNYRAGHYLLEKKRKFFLLWIPYIACLLLYRALSLLFGCSVPFSSKIGNSITFKHGLYGVFISGMAEIGSECIIFHQVTIGSNFGSKKQIGAPNIGNGVLIGAGAKVIGPLNVGDKAIISAGSVVFCSVPPRTTVKP